MVGLTQLDEIGDFLQIVPIFKCYNFQAPISVVKMKHMEEIGGFRHSSSIKGVKMKPMNVNL